jgi:RNA polymerase sigma-70 factor, ECF subfamily
MSSKDIKTDQGFTLFAEKNYNLFIKTANRILHNPSLAEDAVQNALLKMYKNRETFREDSTPITWATRILCNECFAIIRSPDYKRRVDVGTEATHKEDFFDGLASPASDPETLCRAAHIQQEWQTAIEQLPPKYRSVYVLRFVKMLSIVETAQILSLSVQATKSRSKRAVDFVRPFVRRNLERRHKISSPAKPILMSAQRWNGLNPL